MSLIKITKDMSSESLIDFLPKINMNRNQSLINDLCCLPHLSDSKGLILRLLANTIKADFSGRDQDFDQILFATGRTPNSEGLQIIIG